MQSASRFMRHFAILTGKGVRAGKTWPRHIVHQRLAMSTQVTGEIIEKLKAVCGASAVSTAESVCDHHGHDESYHPSKLPDAVVFPTSTQQVSEVVKLCYSHDIPIIPFGTGTGLEGGVSAIQGGVSIDMVKMDKILEVNAEDFDVTVEPGVTREYLNTYIRDTGLWFPVDPGAECSLCGMVATSASGTNAVRYGTMRENVLNLEVVLYDGSIIYTAGEGRRTKKTSAGYNLTNLFTGSEGTIGIITKATLRLYPIPEQMVSAVCSFPGVEEAVTSAVMMLQCGIPVARVEFMDAAAIEICNSYSKTNYDVAPSLFLEFHGSDKSVDDQVEKAAEIIQMNQATNFSWAKKQEDRNRLWKARHSMFYAALAARPGSKGVITDVCVPISNLPGMVMAGTEFAKEANLLSVILGHVGDGNFHAFVVIDPNNKEELSRAKAFHGRLVEKAIELKGTCTGEHGIGMGKMEFLAREVGPSTIHAMKLLKKSFDPKNLFNPGKVINVEMAQTPAT